MKGRLTLAAATVIGLLFAAGTTGASEKLSLRVTPNVSSAPSTVMVRAYITPNTENRWLRIEADSGTFYRSSEIQLEGDNTTAVRRTTVSVPLLSTSDADTVYSPLGRELRRNSVSIGALSPSS